MLWNKAQPFFFLEDASIFYVNKGLEEGKYESWPDISKCFYSFETNAKLHLTIILKEFLS